MLDDVVIREARPADAAQILEYVNACCAESPFLSFGAGEFELTVEQEEAFLGEVAGRDNALFLVAIIDGELVGNAVFQGGQRSRIRHAGELSMLVRRAHWGRGIGAQLLDALVEWARASAVVTKVDLRVREDNDRAIQLYRSRGFVEEGRIADQVVVEGQSHAYLWMGLSTR